MNEAARITVFEKGGDVSFANCGLPYHIGGQIQNRGKLLLATAESFKKAFNVDVARGTRCCGSTGRENAWKCSSSQAASVSGNRMTR